MSGAGGQEGHDGSSVSDDDWDRFLRESVEGTAADAPVEPSARAREVTRRLRENPEPPPGWRTYSPGESRLGAGPRTGPRARRRTAWYVIGIVVTLALLAVAIFPQQVTDLFGGGGQENKTPLAAETGAPTGAPGSSSGLRGTLDDPFRGSPAARWADGAAGITVPAGRATGWMDAAQVDRALRQSRDFLVGAGLDPRVLRGERPAEAIALLNPHQKDIQEYLRTALSPAAPPTADTDPLLLFSRFRPGQAQLVGDTVKTRGRLSFREGKRGAVEVTADVTFVYPVTPAAVEGDPDAEVIRTIVRRVLVMSWDDPSRVTTEPGTMSLVSYALDMTNGGCGEPTGYFVPPFGTGDARPADGGPRIDPYDRSRPVESGDGTTADEDCATATRS
ncbi:hypothetical protein ABZ714_15090 [Streptomyces sp. NPDC006798]|uniref:hypothetical protein n=1 Tax=Streptomyces sp. NPDC006798 TaxID=3155462 RepID=UPI0033DB5853